MKLCFAELVIEISHALDYVEAELVGIQTNHGKRVGYLCALLGRKAGLSDKELLDLTACAVLHDNALSEYIQIEYLSTGRQLGQMTESGLGIHCTIGERNIKGFPFFSSVDNALLYHHENADGSGPFSKKEGEIGLYAALIHLSDQLDVRFAMKKMTKEKYLKMRAYLEENRGVLFGSVETDLFLSEVSYEQLTDMADDRIENALGRALDYSVQEYAPEQVMHMSGIFARIVDYKSTFTSLHSMGIAHKAYAMGAYYGLDEEMRAKLFLAGALHDIGKLAVDVKVLEKPGRLTGEEFEQIKKHALISFQILSRIHGMEDICRWAAYHHEKLNGKGYPFGYDESRLDRYSRLMGCLDIYQALREDRPYKKGMYHEEAMKIMYSMVENGFIDGEITAEIDGVFQEEQNF